MGSGQLAAGLVDRQKGFARAQNFHEIILVLHIDFGLAFEQVIVFQYLMVGLAHLFIAGQTLILHALERRDNRFLIDGAGLDDAVDQQLGADVRASKTVVRVFFEFGD